MGIIYILIALFLGSIGSVALAGLMLILNNQKLETVSTYLMYIAGVTLLGAAFLGMIPKVYISNKNSNGKSKNWNHYLRSLPKLCGWKMFQVA